MIKPLWPREVFEFRERHLRSNAHRLILAIGLSELRTCEHFGVDDAVTNATDEMRKFAFLSLAQLYAETDDESERLSAALEAVLKGRLSS